MMSENKPRLALDLYVLAQGVKTGVYRVCDELFPRLVESSRFEPCFLVREGDDTKAGAYLAKKRLPGKPVGRASTAADADIVLSPFGVPPAAWLADDRVLQAHIVYDLIAIHRPDYFSREAADEVRNIMSSLDEHTVVFAISEYTKKELLDHRPDLRPEQVTVIPLAAGPWFKPCDDAAERARMRAKYTIPPDVPYVLSLATLEIRKNLDQVVGAYVAHMEQHPHSDLHLVLAGMSGWKLEKLEVALAAAGLWRDRIVLTGFVDDADLSALYSDALCFVYLSRYEGFGLPPLEAMACGTPVICADNSSLPEVVADAGLSFDADDVPGVARAIEQLVSSADLRADLSRKGLRRAALFSWDRCADIVAETLLASHAAYAALPAQHRRRSGPLPGTPAWQALVTIDSLPAASVFGYRDGSRGPVFVTHDAPPGPGGDPAWPAWADRLPVRAGVARVEGGRRTQGHLKTGDAARPLVSYVTVVRNNTATLARTLDSVQQQTYDNVEHIVLDGASTDGTLDLIRRYADRLTDLLERPWPLLEDDHELDPPELALTPAAKRTWVALYNDIEHALGKDRELAPVRSLASKAPEHISRLAGTFAVFEGESSISENHVDRAAALMQHYLGEALRLWGTGQVSAELKLAQEVLNWLREKMGPGRAIPLADIYRNGPAAIRSAGTARRVMQLLTHHGWVAAAEHPTAREAFELVAV